MPAIEGLDISCGVSPFDAQRQQKGPFWYNLKEVFQLLKITAPVPVDKEVLFQHVQYEPGQSIHTAGQAFDTLHILSAGFIKTSVFSGLGNEHVLRFPMRGDILGIDGIDTGHYRSDAVALTDCGLISVPYKKLVLLGREHSELESLICNAMSRELLREQVTIRMLAARGAEMKVARFLLALADRFGGMGYSNKLFNLRMTRQDIGSYLGITLETVSRTLSSFNEMGLISVNQRTIGIYDAEKLRALHRLPRTRLPVQQRSVSTQEAERHQSRGEPFSPMLKRQMLRKC